MHRLARRCRRRPAPGEHLAFDTAPGLRLTATAASRTWIYRYKSPLDGRMRQMRLGHWPALSPAAVIAAWQHAQAQRAAGADLAATKRRVREQSRTSAEQQRAKGRVDAYTVRRLVGDYLRAYAGTVAPKTYAELERLFSVELDPIAGTPAAKLPCTQPKYRS